MESIREDKYEADGVEQQHAPDSTLQIDNLLNQRNAICK